MSRVVAFVGFQRGSGRLDFTYVTVTRTIDTAAATYAAGAINNLLGPTWTDPNNYEGYISSLSHHPSHPYDDVYPTKTQKPLASALQCLLGEPKLCPALSKSLRMSTTWAPGPLSVECTMYNATSGPQVNNAKHFNIGDQQAFAVFNGPFGFWSGYCILCT